MRIMRLTILSLLTLLILAIAIPAAATTCSLCLTHTSYAEDGTTISGIQALCDPSVNGDINDCRVVGTLKNQECTSMGFVASCGEGLGGGSVCPPWGCIYYIKDQKIPSMIRPILSAI